MTHKLELDDLEANALLLALDIAIDEVRMARRKIPLMQMRTPQPEKLDSVDFDMAELQRVVDDIRMRLLRMAQAANATR